MDDADSSPERAGRRSATLAAVAPRIEGNEQDRRMIIKPRPAPPIFIPESIDRRHDADRSRFRRIDCNMRNGERPPLAKILLLEGGGRWRPVITRGGMHLRFRMPSRKTGLTQVGEGEGEKRLAFLNEVDARVPDYQCHPWQIISQVNGRRFKYRPDAIRVMHDGTVEVIEVKRTFRDLSDPEYRQMLAKVKEICRQCGFRFRVLYLHDIVPNEHHRDNVDILFGRRYMTFTEQQERRLRALRLAGDPISWSDARKEVGITDVLEGDSVLEGAAAIGMFGFELAEPRTDRTILFPYPAAIGPSPIRI